MGRLVDYLVSAPGPDRSGELRCSGRWACNGAMNRPTLRLNPGQGRRLRAGAPWVFSNEIAMKPEYRQMPPGELGAARRRRRRAVRHLHVQSAQPDRGAAAGSRSGGEDRRGLAAAAAARGDRAARARLRHAVSSPGACRGRRPARPGDRPLRRRRGAAGQHRRDGPADAADRRGAHRLAAAARRGRAQ